MTGGAGYFKTRQCLCHGSCNVGLQQTFEITKVKRFYWRYGANRHKATVLTPGEFSVAVLSLQSYNNNNNYILLHDWHNAHQPI